MLIGDRYYIRATARFVDCESGETVDNTAYAREEQEKKGMDVSQVTGSTSSYARKYALNGLFCIDDVKDADNQDNTAGKGTKGSAKTSGKQEAGKLENRKQSLSAAPAAQAAEADKVTPARIESVRPMVEKYAPRDSKWRRSSRCTASRT